MLGVSESWSAAETSWVEHSFAKSRIVANQDSISTQADMVLYLGWEVVLPVGWKTYWRTPGDAGRPASFNWQGSSNLRAAKVLYPRPERFEIFGLQTFGYEDRALIPIRLFPEHDGLPVGIELDVWFMACRDICVPFEASYSLNLPVSDMAGASPHAAAINARLAMVPEKNSYRISTISIKDIRVRGEAGHQRLAIRLDGTNHLSGADVIVEASQEFRFGKPQKSLVGDGRSAQFVIPIASYRTDADLRGKRLTLTVNDGWGGAVEQEVHIDRRGNAVESLAKSD